MLLLSAFRRRCFRFISLRRLWIFFRGCCFDTSWNNQAWILTQDREVNLRRMKALRPADIEKITQA